MLQLRLLPGCSPSCLPERLASPLQAWKESEGPTLPQALVTIIKEASFKEGRKKMKGRRWVGQKGKEHEERFGVLEVHLPLCV